jgi:hypothetical protein
MQWSNLTDRKKSPRRKEHSRAVNVGAEFGSTKTSPPIIVTYESWYRFENMKASPRIISFSTLPLTGFQNLATNSQTSHFSKTLERNKFHPKLNETKLTAGQTQKIQQMAWNKERCKVKLCSPLFPLLCGNDWSSPRIHRALVTIYRRKIAL